MQPLRLIFLVSMVLGFAVVDASAQFTLSTPALSMRARIARVLLTIRQSTLPRVTPSLALQYIRFSA
jgi:hypothetical protein